MGPLITVRGLAARPDAFELVVSALAGLLGSELTRLREVEVTLDSPPLVRHVHRCRMHARGAPGLYVEVDCIRTSVHDAVTCAAAQLALRIHTGPKAA